MSGSAHAGAESPVDGTTDFTAERDRKSAPSSSGSPPQWRSVTTTRRFCRRPASVAFVAIGFE